MSSFKTLLFFVVEKLDIKIAQLNRMKFENRCHTKQIFYNCNTKMMITSARRNIKKQGDKKI